MEDPEFNPLEAAPKNRAQAWFRVVLWITPAGFACASAAGLSWLKTTYFPSLVSVGVPIWLILNFAFVVGTGWFESQLSARARSESDGVADGVMRFFLFQFFLIPALSPVFLFFACLTNLI